jgi:hypothetical protein
MKKAITGIACALALTLPGAVSAQVAWDSPLLLPPNPAGEFGIFLMDAAGGGVAALGTWRSPSWNFGLRAGIAEDAGDGVALFGGVDYNGVVNRATADFPVDVDWVLGAGLGIGENVLVSIPVGLTAGHRFVGDGATFTPYITPRVVLDGFFGDDANDENLGLDFAIDLGLDLQLPARTLTGMTIRFGGTFGDREAIALGVVF